MAKKKTDSKKQFAFSKENYKLLIIGVVIIVVGYLLMVGGGAESPDQFNPEIFSFRRITLAPLVVLAGFIFVIYAIMKKPKESQEETQN
jgi:drug/metabolite transporter (DMT)-like permease